MPAQTSSPRRIRSRRLLGIILGVLLLLLTGGFVILALKWPFTEAKIASVLQDRAGRAVRIGSFHSTYFPPGCVADNVVFLRHIHRDAPPVVTIDHLVIRSSYSSLLRPHPVIDHVYLRGTHVLIAPKRADGTREMVIPLNSGKKGNVEIASITANGAMLEFLPGPGDAQSTRLLLKRLILREVGIGRALDFNAIVDIPKPPGEISSTGRFGPWNPEHPAQTALTGTYALRNANLLAFKGLSGTLMDGGTLKGTLGALTVTGHTDIPDFHLLRSDHSTHIQADYQALVNGGNGDTVLQRMEARFGHTVVSMAGSVMGQPGKHGKTIRLSMESNAARVEDLMDIVIKSKMPPLKGAVVLRATATIPPDARPFLEKLDSVADLGISTAHFTNPKLQQPLNNLSKSAQGENRKQESEDPRVISSTLKAHIIARGGIATVTDSEFTIPGAAVSMAGRYNLLDETIDLHGKLATDGHLADATSGFKALVVTLISPFFTHHNEKIVPLKVTGTYSHPLLGLDLFHKN